MLKIECPRSQDQLAQNLIDGVGGHTQWARQLLSNGGADQCANAGRGWKAAVEPARLARAREDAQQLTIELGAGADAVERALFLVMLLQCALVVEQLALGSSIGNERRAIAADCQPVVDRLEFFDRWPVAVLPPPQTFRAQPGRERLGESRTGCDWAYQALRCMTCWRL